MTQNRRIGVIGAGPCGITALKNLRDAGFQHITVFDRNRDVGGNWLFSTEPGHSSVFETTHTISSKKLSQYDDFPMPEDYPDYPGHRHLASYFQNYARQFGLYEHIEFGTTVTRAEPRDGGGWRLSLQREAGEPTQVEEREFDELVVCNGHHWDPRMPRYPGQFGGRLLHSHDFKRAAPFAGERVLVIGGGNSACDVAVETSRVAQRTDISMRRGYWITPKFMLGVPTDIMNERLLWLPKPLRTWVSEKILYFLRGSNRSYGLAQPDHRFGETHPTLNSELLYFIRHGKVTPKPDIERFDGHRVHFSDGSQGDYDSVIACTGYRISHPFFDKATVDYSEGPVPLYLKMFPNGPKNLYFIGLFQPLGSIWPLAELQAKILARYLVGTWRLPSDLGRAIHAEIHHPDYHQLDTPRHTITVGYHAFRKRLLKHLPAPIAQVPANKNVRSSLTGA
ncbi:NAD(P)-binding domain-containing protein [Sulfidibacter corallicola]|uniref:NAD(P)-binding domain-containing protein n=1 Tax=Sulfidibacter corallicola TaxID=2818388 RepID=A0A8A4TH34_SULCO|nr:NAD(P)-binding domain-containing protein [Sulfidibacter corallicola]QTD49236.1 NAD(P)-binding domain-containing protein [Sulfidibacter corallicola]